VKDLNKLWVSAALATQGAAYGPAAKRKAIAATVAVLRELAKHPHTYTSDDLTKIAEAVSQEASGC
jgi:hypothetical protein